jgi:hypothetical protein
MPVKQDYARRTFGQITLVARSDTRPGFWKGQCRCGNIVEKRIDNLTRPGNHTCGKCYLATPYTEPDLEERIRRLEELVARLSPQVEGEVRKAQPGTDPSPLASRFSNISYDAEGELWEARSLSGRAFFWGATEEEAAYAARVYLKRTHATSNRRLITDAELTLREERREDIILEISGRV